MKAKELMLGDFITLADSLENDKEPLIFKVVGLGYDGEETALVLLNGEKACDIVEIDKDWSGIPISPEILEKNGFEKLDFSHFQIGNRTLVLDADGRWDGPLSWHWVVTEMDINAKGQSVVLDYYVATINYVHELPYTLRLCGIEKEIIL